MIKSLFYSVALLLSVATGFSADTATQPETPVKDAKGTPPTMAATRDAFLAFAFEKTKNYTGKVEEIASKGVDLAMKEGPELAKEWITWRIWYHALHCAIPLLFLGVFLVMALYGKWEVGINGVLDNMTDTRKAISGLLSALVAVFTFFSLFVDDPSHVRGGEKAHLYSLIQVSVTPRVYVVEHVVELFKK